MTATANLRAAEVPSRCCPMLFFVKPKALRKEGQIFPGTNADNLIEKWGLISPGSTIASSARPPGSGPNPCSTAVGSILAAHSPGFHEIQRRAKIKKKGEVNWLPMTTKR